MTYARTAHNPRDLLADIAPRGSAPWMAARMTAMFGDMPPAFEAVLDVLVEALERATAARRRFPLAD
jgi:hypothetical protein